MMKNYNKDRSLKSIIIITIVLLLSLSFISIFFNIITKNLPNDSISSSEDSSNDESSSNDENYKDGKLIKQLYCQYDSTINFESSVGGLRLYIPTNNGYINYNIIHTINTERNADVWRIGQAFACDNNLENAYPITTQGAEWDMALFLKGREDFIGGYAHGDEKYVHLEVKIDGVSTYFQSINELKSFTEIQITEHSIGYDPNDNETPVLMHYKVYVINTEGIILNQKVEWLNNYTVEHGYLAMMPPLKIYTDTYYVDTDYFAKPIDFNFHYEVSKAVLYSSQFSIVYSMEFTMLPKLNFTNCFQIHDNGGGSYNKMYYYVCQNENVESGDVWETTTVYNIVNG